MLAKPLAVRSLLSGRMSFATVVETIVSVLAFGAGGPIERVVPVFGDPKQPHSHGLTGLGPVTNADEISGAVREADHLFRAGAAVLIDARVKPGLYRSSQRCPLAGIKSPTLTGSPSAPTLATGDNSTRIATDAFMKRVNGYVSVSRRRQLERGTLGGVVWCKDRRA
jgi:hypothetical protein